MKHYIIREQTKIILALQTSFIFRFVQIEMIEMKTTKWFQHYFSSTAQKKKSVECVWGWMNIIQMCWFADFCQGLSSVTAAGSWKDENRNHAAGREQVFVQCQAESRLTRSVQFTSSHTTTEHLSLCRVLVGTEARPRPGYSHWDVKRWRHQSWSLEWTVGLKATGTFPNVSTSTNNHHLSPVAVMMSSRSRPGCLPGRRQCLTCSCPGLGPVCVNEFFSVFKSDFWLKANSWQVGACTPTTSLCASWCCWCVSHVKPGIFSSVLANARLFLCDAALNRRRLFKLLPR